MLGAQEHPAAPGTMGPLIGRDTELDTLAALLDGCVRGHGCVATIGGHAGVGKSRLARELRARSSRIHGEAVTWLWGSAEAHAPRGLQALRQALNSYMWSRSVHAATMPRRELASALRTAMAEDTDLASCEIRDAADALAGFISGVTHMAPDGSTCAASNGAGDLVHAFHAFFLGLAWRRPVVLVLDDYHWADTPTAQLAWRLADVADDAPLYLAVLYRPPIVGEPGSLLAAGAKLDSRYASLHLEDLSTGAAVQLARCMAGGQPISDELASAVLYRCGGNPLFIEETLRPLRDGEMTEERLLGSPVPLTVHDAVRRRLGAMPASSLHALEMAAVIGPRFSAELLWTLADDPTTLDPAMRDLQRRQLVVPQVSRTRDLFAFRHVLLQEAVYESIDVDRRRAAHLALARTLEAQPPREREEAVGEIGLHYAAADVRRKAVELLCRASDRDRALHANETAAEHLERALEVLRRDATDREQEFEVVCALADVRAKLGDSARVEDMYGEALALAAALGRDQEQVGLLVGRQAETQYLLQRYAAAADTARRGLLLVGDAEGSRARVVLLSVLSIALLNDGDWPASVDARARLAEAVAGLGHFDGLVEAYYRLGHVALSAIPDGASEAMQWYARMEAMSREHKDGAGLARSYYAMGSLLANNLNDHRQGLEMHLKCVAEAAHIGHARLLFEGHMQAASLHAELGDDDEADRHVRSGVVAMRRLTAGGGRASFAPEYLEEIADRYAKRGMRDLAARYWREGLAAGASEFLQRRLLKKLEEHYLTVGDHAGFRALCAELGPTLESAPRYAFQRLYLEPGAVTRGLACPVALPAPAPNGDGAWRWTEYMPESTYNANPTDGSVTIDAPCILWNGGYPPDVPHLSHPAPTAFAFETVIDLSSLSPSGGIYLEASGGERMVVGKWPHGEHDVRSVVRRGPNTATISRGILLAEDTLHLRLEYVRGDVRTLCSADGERWLLSAETRVNSDGPPRIGLFGYGCYDSARSTRFASMRLLGPVDGGSDTE